MKGSIVVENSWPGEEHKTDYSLGNNWYSDRPEQELYDGKLQGAKTIKKWRTEVLSDWEKRWNWLK